MPRNNQTTVEKKPERITRNMSVEIFKKMYWSVEELNAFCQTVGLSTNGVKEEKTQRVAHFLRTGVKLAPKTVAQTGPKDSERGRLRRETVVRHYKNDPATRKFFQDQLGGDFKFSVLFHNYRRDVLSKGEAVTYGQLADALREIQKTKKTPTQGLSDACEFNRFLSDYSQHEKQRRPGDAKAAWAKLIQYSGPHNYAHYKANIEGLNSDSESSEESSSTEIVQAGKRSKVTFFGDKAKAVTTSSTQPSADNQQAQTTNSESLKRKR